LAVWHGFFARTGGVSEPPYATLNTAYHTQDAKAFENRERLLTALSLADRPLRMLNPCHGERIVVLNHADWQMTGQTVLAKTEAAFTQTPGCYFLVSTADCIPAIISDKPGSFVGVVHLGWRNLVAGLTRKVIEALRNDYGVVTATLAVGIGPCIYPCCYVYRNPVQRNDPFWQPFLRQYGNGSYGIDLVTAFKAQLNRCGVREENIYETGLCTACQAEQFFSCYRDGYRSGRFATLVGLQANDV
jgi:YfiH family protein